MTYRSAALLLVSLVSAAPATAQEAPPVEIVAGGRALEAGDLEKAEEQFGRVLAGNPEDPAARLGMSRVLEARGEVSSALAEARRAERAAPASPATSFAVGRLLARLGAHNEALVALERTRKLAPNDPEPAILTALVLRDEGRFEDAAAMLSQVWEDGSRLPALGELLGSLYLKLDRPGEAIGIADTLLAIDPDQASLLMIRGLALAKNPDLRAQAVSNIERAIALGPPRPGQAWLELAILRLEGGDAAGALPALRQAERLSPQNPEVHKRLGAALEATGDVDGAEAALARFRALRADLDSAGATVKRLGSDLNAALALAGENRLPEALAALDTILEAAPDSPRVHASRAKVLFSMSRVDEALAAITRARELDPGRSEHHFLEGVFLLGAGRTAEAEAAERRALALDPDLAQAHVMLAGSLAKQGRAEEAAVHFERALALGADTPPLRLGYAAVLGALGREAESAEQMEAYRRLKE